ncbi:MAG: response regulator [Actinomycetota bacterium]
MSDTAIAGVLGAAPGLAPRAAALAEAHDRRCRVSADRLFIPLMLLQWLAAVAIALWLSPRAWDGVNSSIHLHVWVALGLGGALTLFPVALAFLHPGEGSTRQVVAMAQMLMSALLIHLTGGRIETHFHIFGSLALLAFYRDWRVLITASIVVALHHLGWGTLWPQSVFGDQSGGAWRWLEHAGWVVFEDVFLIIAISRSRREVLALAEHQAEVEEAKAATERIVEARTRELKASESRFRSLAASAPIGIFQADVRGRWTYANEHWFTLSGMDAAAALGEGWADAVHPDDRERVLRAWHRVARSGEEWSEEFRIRDAAGEIRWVHSRATAIPATEQSAAGAVGTVEDVTSHKEFQAALEAGRDAALEANRAKSEFLATMSHEIRTPLNAIIGSADLLWETTLTTEQAEYVGMFRRAGATLLEVINDILDLSKIEAGHLELDLIEFDLVDLVEQAAQIVAARAHEKQIELVCSLDPQLPSHVYGDPTRIRQVLLNLLGNAVKFTERGEVALTVSGDPDLPAGGVRFSVKDTGIGIPADKLGSIFASFTQADSSTTRKYGGTGLGLTISRRLVELMDGELGVESCPGVGSTFTFSLTLPAAKTVTAASPVPVELQGMRALIVDDNATNRRILREFLTGWGMLINEAESGAAAIAALEGATTAGSPYRLILLDCRMPEMDGFEVAASVGRSTAVAQVTIMMLTSDGRGGDISRARALGLGSYLVKPVKRAELYDAIIATLGKSCFAAPNGSMISAAEATVDANCRPLRILLAEDSADNQLLIQAYLKRHPYRIDLAGNGQEALQRYQDARYDLVLMDVQMPEMDGYTATRAIRAWERVSGRAATPILALTANAMQDDVLKSESAGCTAHLTKPINKSRLLEAIVAYARRPADDTSDAGAKHRAK